MTRALAITKPDLTGPADRVYAGCRVPGTEEAAEAALPGHCASPSVWKSFSSLL